ncbi:MAG: glycosyltransferase family 4 protein [Synergistaceae bacterium]|nr:glycosyltransferase family 4 protein [Synergistaceae bacterium]
MPGKIRVHLDMQCVDLPCGMGRNETEIALRLMKYDDLDITASYFLPIGDDRNVRQFDFPVRRVKIPTPLVYHALPVKKRRIIHAIEKPLFWLARHFVSYDSLVGDTGNNVYVFFENRIPVVPVKGKIIAVINDLIPLVFAGSANRGREVNTRINTEEIIRRADRIISISEYTKKTITDLFSTGDKNIDVIHVGVDPNAFSGSYDASNLRKEYALPEKYILYFGSCQKNKNVESLVKAYALLPERLRAEYRLLITNPSDSVKECIDQSGIAGNVHFLHNVPEKDKPAIYREASLFVWPSFYEGFGMPVTEAQAAGIPVVCSNATSMPEAAGDGAVFFDPENVGEIKAAIERCLEDENLRRELVAKGYENVKRFSWDESARKFHDIITSL